MLQRFTDIEDCCCYYSGMAEVSVTPGGDVDVQSVQISRAVCKVAKLAPFQMLPNSEEHWRKLEQYVANELEYRDEFVEQCKLAALSETYVI